MLSITPQAPQQKIGPVSDDGTFTRPWYLFLTDVSKALADFIAGAVYGRPTLLHLNRVTKVTDSGTIGEAGFLDTDVVTGAPTLTHVGRVTKVTATGVIGEAAFLGTDVVLGAPTLTDVNRIPKVSAAGTLGESAVSDDGTTVTALARQMAITGSTPEYKASTTGGTQPGRFAKLWNDDNLYVALNLSFDGANWNLDDTSKTGTVLRLNLGTLVVFNATAGANPRTLTQTFTVDSAGKVGMGGNTSPGYSGDATGDINASGVFRKGGTQVLGARQTGWTAATNTASRATFDTTIVTTAQLAQRVKALIDDLMTTGVIGT